MGPTQLAEVLRLIPTSTDPGLLVGFETSDDAGVFVLPGGVALVQTVDFFTPVVDDPYAYGAIAAANALSDVYAMGGRPITVLNIACFDPAAAPAEVWAQVLKGAYDKTTEAGAVILGGHTVEDKEPKFGMAVTGLIDPERAFANTQARPGDRIFLSKPLGTGIVTTAAKFDAAAPEVLDAAIATMSALNRSAAEAGLGEGVRCATDVTGFGLVGHLFHIARASGVRIQIESKALPLLPQVLELAEAGNVTGGARRNREFLGDQLVFADSVSEAMRQVVLDPQTSGGLALFHPSGVADYPRIGSVTEGEPGIEVV